jgi:hypothetical protein
VQVGDRLVGLAGAMPGRDQAKPGFPTRCDGDDFRRERDGERWVAAEMDRG